VATRAPPGSSASTEHRLATGAPGTDIVSIENAVTSAGGPRDQEGETVKISRQPKERAMVLQLSGDIMGGKDYDTFTNEIKKLVEEGHVDIVLDLAKVRYINSTGLGILVSGLTTLKKNMGQMKICNLSDRIDRLFSVTSLTTVFATFESLDEAMASFEE
jgi:anti-sigma B factor antagonist